MPLSLYVRISSQSLKGNAERRLQVSIHLCCFSVHSETASKPKDKASAETLDLAAG